MVFYNFSFLPLCSYFFFFSDGYLNMVYYAKKIGQGAKIKSDLRTNPFKEGDHDG